MLGSQKQALSTMQTIRSSHTPTTPVQHKPFVPACGPSEQKKSRMRREKQHDKDIHGIYRGLGFFWFLHDAGPPHLFGSISPSWELTESLWGCSQSRLVPRARGGH